MKADLGSKRRRYRQRALPRLRGGPIWGRRELSRSPQRDGLQMPLLPSPPIALPRPMVALAALVAVLVAGAVALWVHYGTAVFYEMIAAGIASCL